MIHRKENGLDEELTVNGWVPACGTPTALNEEEKENEK
jgi:hypothetical protein